MKKQLSVIISLLICAFLASSGFAGIQKDNDDIEEERHFLENTWHDKSIKSLDQYDIERFKRAYKDFQIYENDEIVDSAFNKSGITDNPSDLNPIKGTSWYFLYQIISLFDDIITIDNKVYTDQDDGSVYLGCCDKYGRPGIATYMSSVVPNSYVSGPVFTVFIPGTTLNIFYQFKINQEDARGIYFHIDSNGNPSNTYLLVGQRLSGPDPEIQDDIQKKTVYRFYKPSGGFHFYTASKSERDHIINNLEKYNYEGESFQVPVGQVDGSSPVYRFYNQSTGAHFYTILEKEKNKIMDTLPKFNYESIAYYAYPQKTAGTIPLYRFYNRKSRAHFFTPSETEKENVIENMPAFKFEGVAYYVYPKPQKMKSVANAAN